MSRVGFTLPNVFGAKTVKGPLSDLDANFNPLKNAILDSGNGWVNYAAVSGTVNAINLTNNPPCLTLNSGATFAFRPTGPNTGSVTINVDGLGATAVVSSTTNSPLVGGELVGLVTVIYVPGTGFYVISSNRPAQYLGVDTTNTVAYAAAVRADFTLVTGVIVGLYVQTNINTVASPTLNVNGTGAFIIKNKAGTGIGVGELQGYKYHTLMYDGSGWVILSFLTKIYTVTDGTPSFSCAGYDAVRAYITATVAGTSLGVVMTTLNEGMHIMLDIVNATGAAKAYYVNGTNIAGSAIPVTQIMYTTATNQSVALRIDSTASPALNAGTHMCLMGSVFAGQLFFK